MSITGEEPRTPAGARARIRPAPSRVPGGSLHHSAGFWFAAAAFLVDMAFSAVPTPLYVLYQQRDHFSTVVVTVVYAVYAIGVIGSLFLGGHVSDWVGRKRVFVTALLVNALSAVVFLVAPSLPGLIVARVVSGISVGLVTATATAYLGELHARGRASARPGRRAQVVATAANLGGIGVGPLVAGLLAQYAPAPLRLPYVLFGAALVVLAVLVAVSPETVPRPDPAPAWRPQRIAVPPGARALFFAATAAGISAFAVFGVFNSLAPSFLAGTMHQHSHAVAGAVPFAAFASSALAQVAFSRVGVRATLRVSPWLMLPGLGLLTAGMWAPNMTLFVVGGVITGAGGGLLFRGALAAAASSAAPGARAEVLAGYFLGAYVGLSLPVVGLGLATRYVAAQDVMLVFVVVVAVAVLMTLRAVLQRTGPAAPGRAAGA